jgi:hypothetical protein
MAAWLAVGFFLGGQRNHFCFIVECSMHWYSPGDHHDARRHYGSFYLL